MRCKHSSAVAVVLLAIAGLAAAANGAVPPAGGTAPQSAPAPLGRVTIEASKDRQALRHKVDNFVAAVVVQPWNDPLYRWNKPVCPLVAGLPRAEGEFILQRISQVAVDAHAPLDGRVCHPNLFVVATAAPDLLLRQWWARDHRRMHEFDWAGSETVRAFLHSRRPIRVWYNTGLSCGDGGLPGPGTAAILGVVLPNFQPPGCTLNNSRLSRSSNGTNIASAIVIVDLRQMQDVTMGQMADYVALVGLANVRLDAGSVPEPSILQLFQHATAPPGLSAWDRALLYSLYTTNQWDYLQLQDVKTTMVSRLAP